MTDTAAPRTESAEADDDLSANPLLSGATPIPFDEIEPRHVVPAFREALARAADGLQALIALREPRTYENTIQALDQVGERLTRIIRPVSHLTGVMNSPELRQAYETVLPEVSAFYARIPLNPELWAAVKAYAETDEARALTGVRARHLHKLVRSFVRAGADLPPERKARVEALRVEMSRLSTEFANHVLDATNAWDLVLTDEADLEGLPESARAQARAAAEAKGVEGWRFTLQMPSFQPFLQYSVRRDLRERMYHAYMNRASSGEHDNRPLVKRILELRRELSGILGFRDYADLRAGRQHGRQRRPGRGLRGGPDRAHAARVAARDGGAGDVRPRGAGDAVAGAVGRVVLRGAAAAGPLRAGCRDAAPLLPPGPRAGGAVGAVEAALRRHRPPAGAAAGVAPGGALLRRAGRGRGAAGLVLRGLVSPREQARRGVDGRHGHGRPPPRRMGAAPGQHRLQRLAAGGGAPRAAHPPRGQDGLPRVRPPAAPRAVAGGGAGAGRHARPVRLGGAAVADHGELDLGAAGPGPVRAPLGDGRAHPPGALREDAGGAHLHGRLQPDAAAELRHGGPGPARALRPGARTGTPSTGRGR